MFYLGQSIATQSYSNSPKVPGIITGFNENYSPLITFLDKNNELVKHKSSFLVDTRIVRVKNKKSPTGYSIYNGEFVKKGVVIRAKMKLPEDEALIKELKNIQKILDTE